MPVCVSPLALGTARVLVIHFISFVCKYKQDIMYALEMKETKNK